MAPHIAFQMDALHRLDHQFDTTLDLARAAAEQGFDLFHYEPNMLRLSIVQGSLTIKATGSSLLYHPAQKNAWSLGEPVERNLADFDILLMRQDPPFNLAYISATHILEHLKDQVRIINDPVGVRNAPEKLLITYFPHLMAPTLISRDRKAIEAFRQEHKDIIIKPLHGYAGHGVFHIRPEDDNLPSLLETLGTISLEPWIIQKFLPVTRLGDKRIVLFDGEPVGQFRRMPLPGDVRGSMRVGGTAELAPLTPRDREICSTLAPELRKRGLFLAGLDVIGDYLTEINVTSPSGLVDVDLLERRQGRDRLAEQFWRRLLG